MKDTVQPGLTDERVLTVKKEMCINWVGTKLVFSTPSMIWEMEEAARHSLLPHLDEGEETVGTVINVRHLAATPCGNEVRVTATLTEVDRRRCVWDVEAYDDHEKIGDGTVERFIIDVEKFAAQVEAKGG